MADVLDDDALRTALAELPAWTGDTHAIARTVQAPDFPTAIRIVDDVAEVAEQRNHHPDIDIRWRNLQFTLSTHSAGGVTPADVELAQAIDGIATRHSA
ncbi:MAG: 4a-hydroxytetrahydrobiopterin dehydratase [Streptosporangiales bacterium]|nr:4a-hydroxytetrahydrobiopterin dehydratase [Streptosporangiales bacterium]MBO0890703.1 4a-hydroxytetrahydrobiopterin dehydratase [Acidothermales bacterium]